MKLEEKLFTDSDILIRNNDKVMFSEVDGESVIMHLESGNYFGLNSVSTAIWKHLENNISFKELIELLVSEYDVTKKQCVSETGNIINALLKMKFITKKE